MPKLFGKRGLFGKHGPIDTALRRVDKVVDSLTRDADALLSQAAGMQEGVTLGHALNPDSDKHKVAAPVPAPAPALDHVDTELEAALKLSLEASLGAEEGVSSSEIAAPITEEPATEKHSEDSSIACGDPALLSQAQIHQPTAVEPVDLAVASILGHAGGYL